MYCHVHQRCAANVAPAGKAKALVVPAAKKAPSKKAPSKKAPSKKAPSKKAPSKKSPSKKVLAKKASVKKVPSTKKKSPPKERKSLTPRKIPDIYDLIELETFTAEDYLKKDKDNIVIVVDDNNSLALNRKDLKKTIVDEGDFFYECKEGLTRQLRVGENDVKGDPLVLLRGQGNYFIYAKDLEMILRSKDRVFELIKGGKLHRITHSDVIDTGDMINWKGLQIAAASSWHCQEGTESSVYIVKVW